MLGIIYIDASTNSPGVTPDIGFVALNSGDLGQQNQAFFDKELREISQGNKHSPSQNRAVARNVSSRDFLLARYSYPDDFFIYSI